MHYGDHWYEQRETILQERNFRRCKMDDFICVKRQKALREVERQREQGRLPLTKWKTWRGLECIRAKLLNRNPGQGPGPG
jgi:hypothetical protein